MQTESFQRHALLPKPVRSSVPAIPAHLAPIAGPLTTNERLALREIVNDADLIEVSGETFLVARVHQGTIDALAAFEAEGAEIEDGDEDRCDCWDDDPAHADSCGASPGPGDLEDAEDDDPAGECLR